MIPSSPQRTVAVLAAVAVGALGVPMTASASDATFAKSALAGLKSLAVQEAELNVALTKIDDNDDATIQAARTSTAAVRQADVLLSLKISKLKTSSATGAKAKSGILSALKSEYQGFGLVDQGLRAYQDGDATKGKALVQRGSVKLKAARVKAVAAGKLLRKITGSTRR